MKKWFLKVFFDSPSKEEVELNASIDRIESYVKRMIEREKQSDRLIRNLRARLSEQGQELKRLRLEKRKIVLPLPLP